MSAAESAVSADPAKSVSSQERDDMNIKSTQSTESWHDEKPTIESTESTESTKLTAISESTKSTTSEKSQIGKEKNLQNKSKSRVKLVANRVSRSTTEDPIFGYPSPLPETVLPTYTDVGKAILYIQKTKTEGETACLQIPLAEILRTVCSDIEELWKKASVPTVSTKTITDKLKILWEQRRKVQSMRDEKKRNAAFEKQRAEWSKALFDVARCKCSFLDCAGIKCVQENCTNIHILCSCPCGSKIPQQELLFVSDQRGPRKLCIGGMDVKVSHSLQVKAQRKEAEDAQIKKEEARLVENAKQMKEAQSFMEEDADLTSDMKPRRPKNEDDPDYHPFENCQKFRNYTSLANLACACDRFGVSNTAGAFIANAVLKDLGLLKEEDIIDKKKLARHRLKNRQKERREEENRQKQQPITGFYFDGRKDATLTWSERNGVKRRKVELEEHYSIVEEPESRFIGHVTPKQGTGLGVALALYDKMVELNALHSVKVLGADGTNVIVGWKKGVMTFVERFRGEEVQRLICLLHGNELTLRAPGKKYLGKTSGPYTFQGPLNEDLQDPHLTERPIVKFKKIETDGGYECDEAILRDLSTDQKYLLEMCKGVIAGKIDESLAGRQPGKRGHARWLTLANGLLRVYVSTENPSKELVSMVNIILKHYGKMWFHIRKNSKCTDGSKNVFKMIELLRDLPLEDQLIMQKPLQHNAHFAHTEWVLLTMLVDESRSIRERAVKTILNLRVKKRPKLLAEISEMNQGEDEDVTENEEESEVVENEVIIPKMHEVRIWRVPKLNFEASSYVEMTDWSKDVHEPPLVKHLSDDELIQCIEVPLEVPNYPCHTQMVERAVKNVTEAAGLVVGQNERDGFIRQRIKSRTIIPKFESKKDALPLLETENSD